MQKIQRVASSASERDPRHVRGLSTMCSEAKKKIHFELTGKKK